jgi:hypothetical protein
MFLNRTEMSAVFLFVKIGILQLVQSHENHDNMEIRIDKR